MRRRRSDDSLLTPRTLGAALAAELAVWALLDVIRHVVGHRLDGQITLVWIAGRRLVRNTQALHILNATQARAQALADELERHRQPAGGRQE